MKIDGLEKVNESYKMAAEFVVNTKNYDESYTGTIKESDDYLSAILVISNENEVVDRYFIIDWDTTQDMIMDYLNEELDDILRRIPEKYRYCFDVDQFYSDSDVDFGDVLENDYPDCEYFDEIDDMLIYKI